MKRPWFKLRPADEDFLSSAPERLSDTMEIPLPADAVGADL